MPFAPAPVFDTVTPSAPRAAPSSGGRFLAVVDGATLACSAGSMPAPLSATHAGIRGEGAAFATVADHTPANLKPFGQCRITGAACAPITPMPWQPGGSLLSSFLPILVECSQLPCTIGGLVRITRAGQTSIHVTAAPALSPFMLPPLPPDDDDDDGGGLIPSIGGAIAGAADAAWERRHGVARTGAKIGTKAIAGASGVGVIAEALIFPDSTSPNDVIHHAREHDSGKTGRKSNPDVERSADEKIAELQAAKRDAKTKAEKDAIQKQIEHQRRRKQKSEPHGRRGQ